MLTRSLPDAARHARPAGPPAPRSPHPPGTARVRGGGGGAARRPGAALRHAGSGRVLYGWCSCWQRCSAGWAACSGAMRSATHPPRRQPPPRWATSSCWGQRRTPPGRRCAARSARLRACGTAIRSSAAWAAPGSPSPAAPAPSALCCATRSGDCIVDPEGAEVLPRRRRVWREFEYRYHEAVIALGERIYVLGELTSVHAALDTPAEERADISALLGGMEARARGADAALRREPRRHAQRRGMGSGAARSQGDDRARVRCAPRARARESDSPARQTAASSSSRSSRPSSSRAASACGLGCTWVCWWAELRRCWWEWGSWRDVRRRGGPVAALLSQAVCFDPTPALKQPSRLPTQFDSLISRPFAGCTGRAFIA